MGQSYGGAVITQASSDLDNVVGLVYLAAFSLEVGESVHTVQEHFPRPLLAKTAHPTPYDAVGATGGPNLYHAGAGRRRGAGREVHLGRLED